MGGSQSDIDLLDAWQAGDKAAGEALFERHFSSLFRFFRNKVGDELAEDLTQTTFVACVDSRERFRRASSFRTYLFGIARNQLFLHFRRQRRDGAFAFDTVSVADLAAGPATIMRARAEQRLLAAALRRIPVDFQIAVELYYWEDLSTKEIAEILEIAEGTARSRLTRARAQLAEQMRVLADSPELAESTIGGLDRWAKSLGDASG